jgi:hypothetical protein
MKERRELEEEEIEDGGEGDKFIVVTDQESYDSRTKHITIILSFLLTPFMSLQVAPVKLHSPLQRPQSQPFHDRIITLSLVFSFSRLSTGHFPATIFGPALFLD